MSYLLLSKSVEMSEYAAMQMSSSSSIMTWTKLSEKAVTKDVARTNATANWKMAWDAEKPV